MDRYWAQDHPDHDACGTGFIVRLGHDASHEVVERGLEALQRLSHRGGVDADGASGDGAGLMTDIPQAFMRRVAGEAGIALPSSFALGMLFIPADSQARVREDVESMARAMSLKCLGWRDLPLNRGVLGALAQKTLPSIQQCFLAPARAIEDLEAQLFLFRKRIEAKLSATGTYFCSLSSRTVVYKGLLAPRQLRDFYPDLKASDFKSRFAIFHQRFSTNTRPSWSLAQPFRFLAHNGEINTITGNRRWLRAREAELRCRLGAGDWFRALEENVSDSASLDNALELFLRQRRSIETGLLTLVPPAFEADSQLDPHVRDFLESAAERHEPWDGPAALVFSDGRMLGIKLDRNGLRPLRYQRTGNGWLVAGSEAGIADFNDQEISERKRLAPGEMLGVELDTGVVLSNDELLQRIALQAHPKDYARPSRLPSTMVSNAMPVAEPRKVAAALGWSEDQVRFLLQPLAQGKEAMWSMGDDAPPAFLSKMRRTAWDYCKQRFAQVTNPPIDPLREAHVMSLQTHIGQDFIAESPLLSVSQLLFLREKLAPCREIDVTFPASRGVSGAYQALDRIRSEVRESARTGRRVVILSDRRVGPERAVLPILLATAAAWRAMVQSGNFRVPLVVETAQVIETHHLAMLLAVGATAVCPFLALQLAEEHHVDGATHYSSATHGGLQKVLSRMGISTLASYRNAQLFEVVGLDAELCREFFENAERCAEAASLEEVLGDYLYNHALTFASAQAGLKDAGLYRFRKEGESHGTSPELIRKLHGHVKARGPDSYRQYEELAQQRPSLAIRDLLAISFREPVDVSNVEAERDLLGRFSTQAMSVGAISPEAHRTLALAMNQIGARSNTGEGGEDPALRRHQPEAACKIKQVASGRFGVTAEYLVGAEELEIKMAQGSKPGEGGQLPAAKVSAYIARLRHTVPGIALISPPPHHDIYSIEDLEQLIHDLREVNPRARIGVKLVSGAGVGIIAAGVAKAGADVITISGHDGGTGASPLSSIKNTGLPWEFGLRSAHRTLVEAGLRHKVRLRVDGGLKFARDVVMAALLGADEFGFGTAALLAIGCVMARQCHLNTCPVGIATQDESLRARFAGQPQMVIAYFEALASEVRSLLSQLGARSLAEIVGHTEYLQPRDQCHAGWVRALLEPVADRASVPKNTRVERNLAHQLTAAGVASGGFLRCTVPIMNHDRSVGAHLSGELVRRAATSTGGSPQVEVEFQGTAGQSFGAFLVSGVSFRLLGEANDYVGKGLSGGTISISAGPEASRRRDVLGGNTILYGATSGELYVAGTAGERFAVRNSGALAVVEGVGDHGCEYMTGGVVLILGPAGKNLGSGMTGGLIYMPADCLDPDPCNREFVRAEDCSIEETNSLRLVLQKHRELTGSPYAEALLKSGEQVAFTRLQPVRLACPVAETWAPILRRLQTCQQDQPSPTTIPLPALESAGTPLLSQPQEDVSLAG
jgi:glutamate synthase (NADPH/NADH) large chain/glutamate synthase (ferredoxin)